MALSVPHSISPPFSPSFFFLAGHEQLSWSGVSARLSPFPPPPFLSLFSPLPPSLFYSLEVESPQEDTRLAPSLFSSFLPRRRLYIRRAVPPFGTATRNLSPPLFLWGPGGGHAMRSFRGWLSASPFPLPFLTSTADMGMMDGDFLKPTKVQPFPPSFFFSFLHQRPCTLGRT